MWKMMINNLAVMLLLEYKIAQYPNICHLCGYCCGLVLNLRSAWASPPCFFPLKRLINALSLCRALSERSSLSTSEAATFASSVESACTWWRGWAPRGSSSIAAASSVTTVAPRYDCPPTPLMWRMVRNNAFDCFFPIYYIRHLSRTFFSFKITDTDKINWIYVQFDDHSINKNTLKREEINCATLCRKNLSKYATLAPSSGSIKTSMVMHTSSTKNAGNDWTDNSMNCT